MPRMHKKVPGTTLQEINIARNKGIEVYFFLKEQLYKNIGQKGGWNGLKNKSKLRAIARLKPLKSNF